MSDHEESFSSEYFLSVSVFVLLWNSSKQFTDRHWSTDHTLHSTVLGHNPQPLILKRQESHLTVMSVCIYRHISEKESPPFEKPKGKGEKGSKNIYKKIVTDLKVPFLL